jgi:hypothetical protein
VPVEVAEGAVEAELAGGGQPWSMKDVVSRVLSSWDALTPSVLRLLASMAMYLTLVEISPLSQKPDVYEPRKNSSDVNRLSLVSQ